MKFREKSISKFYAFALAAVFAIALAGCGGGGGSTATAPPDETPMPTPQEMCEGDGGRWNADMTCTTAAELMMERQAAQRSAISTAIGTATNAVNAVGNDSTDAEVSAADSALANARSAIAAAGDLSAEEKAANTGTVDALATVLAGAKTARMEAMDAAEMAANMAMAATAAKLYAGIYAPAADATGTDIGDVHAAYNADDSAIVVTMGDGTATNATTLSEDKKTMVAANHGWAGKRYADPAGGDSVEAVVYSDVEAPKPGKKFGGAAANNEFEYALTNGMITVATDTAGVPARIALTGVTRTAGTETFKLPDPNPQGATMITVPGSFHGVSGTYSCTPSTPADGCSASVAARGFTLAGGTWMFKPGDPNARVMSSMDTMYASYGWWLHKSADGKSYTASAFFDYKGGDGSAELASGLDTLNGTATYMGGAAGKYALSSSTGGTNDAGHFTASVTLEADFTDNMISGTIDNFMGADGMARDWSVELMDTAVSAAGVIAGDGTTGNTARQKTKWTIGGTAGAASGEWTGQLYENGTDRVPKTAAGTFFSMYGMGNSMVGAFGANKK